MRSLYRNSVLFIDIFNNVLLELLRNFFANLKFLSK